MAFPDQTVFTAYVPYLGLNLFRKGYKFFKSNRLEQATIPITQSAAWIPPGGREQVKFNRMSATPILGRGPHPEFEIVARNDAGDHIAFTAAPYGLSRFYIDRPILGGLVESHWNYNEYMFRMDGLTGSVGGQGLRKHGHVGAILLDDERIALEHGQVGVRVENTIGAEHAA